MSEIGSFLGTAETNRKSILKVISKYLVFTDRKLNIWISRLIFVNYVVGTFSKTIIFRAAECAVWEP